MYTSNDWYSTSYPGSYTVSYTTSTGQTIYETYDYPIPAKRHRRRQEPELDEGDTTALDDFLGGFRNAKE